VATRPVPKLLWAISSLLLAGIYTTDGYGAEADMSNRLKIFLGASFDVLNYEIRARHIDNGIFVQHLQVRHACTVVAE